MLTAKHINYTIEGKVLLDDVSVAFEAGRLNLVIGPNGAGKSTLIRILCSQIQHDKGGDVFYGDKNAKTASLSEMARIRSVLSQNIDLAFPLTVAEVVMMGRYPHFTGKPAARDVSACEEAMHFFDLQELAGRNYLTLSGGEKQRVHFARVLSQVWYPVPGRFRYLVLDEPLTFLDVHYQFDFMHKLTALLKNKDLVVVGVVHDLNLAARFADKIVLLHQGRVLADGDKEEVLTKENIKAAYRLEPVIRYENNGMFLYFG